MKHGSIARGAFAFLCLASASAAWALTNDDVLGFENPAGWSSTSASLASSASHVQGNASLSVSGISGSAQLRSAPLSTVAGLASPLSLQIQLPAQEPNPFWFGQLQVSLDAPSRGVFNQFVGQKDLTGLPAGSFTSISIPIPDAIVSALGSGSYADLTILITLNVPSPGPYLLDALGFGAPASDGLGTNPRKVHVLYIVPSDRTVNQAYVNNLTTSVRHLQGWFPGQVGGKTFTVTDPVVRVIQSSQSSLAFQTGNFDGNIRAEANAQTGIDVSNDPSDKWLVYIDTPSPCNNGTGAIGSAATFPTNDLLGLTGQATIDVCTGQPQALEPRCRWVGGMGHELGHTLGLPHPPECEDNDPGTICPDQALMWLGYTTYPDAFFTASDLVQLNQDPQLQAEPQLSGFPTDCSQVAN